MDRFKGTPGPWQVGVIGPERKFVYCDDSLGSAICQFDLDYTIALSQQAKKANAQLIAAAPDLLEALVKVVDLIDGVFLVESTDKIYVNEAIITAEAAINKALGL